MKLYSKKTSLRQSISSDESNLKASFLIMLTALFISRTVIFGGFAPFGVSFIAAFSGRRKMLPAFIGSMLGYLLSPGSIDPVKYIAAAVMLFIACELIKRHFNTNTGVYAVTSFILSLGTTGLLFLLSDGAEPIRSISYIAEMLLGAVSCTMFRTIVVENKMSGTPEGKEKRMICVFTLLAVALASVPELGLWGLSISIGRLAGMALIILAANSSGVYGGVITGIIIGLTMDITGIKPPVYTAAYAAAGLCAGLPANKNRLHNSVIFIVAELAVTLLISENGVLAGNIFEALAAGLLFAAIPERLGAKLCDIKFDNDEKYGERIKRRLLAKLAGMSSAYSELAKNVSENKTVENAPKKFNPFWDSYRFVCRECENNSHCWKEKSEQTLSAMSRAQLPALARGRAEPGDFGIEFSIMCKNIKILCAYTTNSIRRHREEKRRLAEKDESKKLLSKQYEQLSEILDISAEELSEDMLFEKQTETKVKKAMAEMNVRCEALVYRDKNNMLHLELCGQGIADLGYDIPSLTDMLSEIVGCRLSKPEQIVSNGICCFSFKQNPTYFCEIGACAEKKQSENISGDCGTYFVGKDGCTYIILCDGMGSGRQAYNEAQNALKLLESFLKAGIDAQCAANIVKSALEVKADESKYATIDITVINPVTSQALIIKCGAPPTYIRRRVALGEYAVIEIDADLGSYTPLSEAFVKTVRLKQSDMIIMASDGADLSGENKIIKYLKKINSDEPRELSDILLKAAKHENQSDDRTIIAILYEKALQEV